MNADPHPKRVCFCCGTVLVVVDKSMPYNVACKQSSAWFLQYAGASEVLDSCRDILTGSTNHPDETELFLYVCDRCVAKHANRVLARSEEHRPPAAHSIVSVSKQLKARTRRGSTR